MEENASEPLTRWLEDARNGDRAAFDRLCEQVSSERCLLAILARLPAELRTKVDGEDVLQIVLARAWHDIGQLGEVNTEGFHRWLAGIARHVVADMIRRFNTAMRSVRREERFEQWPEANVFGDRHSPSRSFAQREQAQRVGALLGKLKERQRAVVVSRVLEGYTTEETAKRLDLTPENVRVTLFRALAKLREQLDQEGIDSTLFRPM